MASGKVKFFDDQKGYGFIQPDAGGSDVFVHKSSLEKCGLVTLQQGQTVEYEVVKDDRNGKLKAENIKHVPPKA